MATNDLSGRPGRGGTDGTPAPGRPPLSWPLVLGLGSLALLWPLAEVTGLSGALGRPAAPLLILGLVAAIWIGCVGVLGVPRPVLTLTLAGAVHGGLLVALSLAFGDRPDPFDRTVLTVLVAGYEVLQAILLGALAGTIALAVQQLRGGRR